MLLATSVLALLPLGATAFARGDNVVLGAAAAAAAGPAPPPGEECARFGVPAKKICAKSLLFNSTLDHFDPTSSATWAHRYLFRDDEWGKGSAGTNPLPNGCPGPILLYTGNEGPITAFWGSNGFMVDYLAPKWGAMLLFPEERYYGSSLPFGDKTFEAENLKYLTTEQILEDYVELVDHLKATIPKAANCPVLAFGGSYGGTLTTFLRAKYPATVIGGLAASAPIGYYDKEAWVAHGVDEFTWSDIVTNTYATAFPGGRCLTQIVAAMKTVEQTPTAELVKAFGVCEAAGLGPEKTSLFAYALEGLPQQDYPYAIGALPAWPVNHTCKELVAAGSSAPKLLAAAVGITQKVVGNGQAVGPCIPTQPEGPGEVPGDGPGDDSAWGWQSCTENLHQFSARGPVRSYTFDLEKSAKKPCGKVFNDTAVLDPMALTHRYGGFQLADGNGVGVNHLIWSNGLLDPWHGGGFLTPGNASSGNHWLMMEHGAHHLDLRGPHPCANSALRSLSFPSHSTVFTVFVLA